LTLLTRNNCLTQKTAKAEAADLRALSEGLARKARHLQVRVL
jgi:hypothetical protein